MNRESRLEVQPVGGGHWIRASRRILAARVAAITVAGHEGIAVRFRIDTGRDCEEVIRQDHGARAHHALHQDDEVLPALLARFQGVRRVVRGGLSMLDKPAVRAVDFSAFVVAGVASHEKEGTEGLPAVRTAEHERHQDHHPSE